MKTKYHSIVIEHVHRIPGSRALYIPFDKGIKNYVWNVFGPLHLPSVHNYFATFPVCAGIYHYLVESTS